LLHGLHGLHDWSMHGLHDCLLHWLHGLHDWFLQRLHGLHDWSMHWLRDGFRHCLHGLHDSFLHGLHGLCDWLLDSFLHETCTSGWFILRSVCSCCVRSFAFQAHPIAHMKSQIIQDVTFVSIFA
jgi:hypothetical protein